MDTIGHLVRRSAPTLAMFSVSYLLLNLLGLQLAFPPTDLAVFWPAAGVAIAVVARSPRSLVVPLLVCVALVNSGAGLFHGRPVDLVLTAAVANVAETAVAAALLWRWIGRRWLAGPTEYARFSLAVVAGCSVGAAVASLGTLGQPELFWRSAWVWSVSDGLGALVVAPLLLLPRHDAPPATLTTTATRSLDRWWAQALVSAGQVAVVWAVFVDVTRPLLSVPAIGAVAAASTVLRPRWAALALALSASGAVWLTAQARGPAAVPAWSIEQRASAVAGFVLVAALVSVTITLTLAARRRDSDLLQLIVTLSRVAMARHDASGELRLANPAWDQLVRHGRPWITHVHPADRAAAQALSHQATTGDAVEDVELRLISLTGQEVWVSAGAAPTPGGGTVTTLTDVTGQRRARQLEVLDQVLRHAPTATLLLRGDVDGLTVVQASRSARALLGDDDDTAQEGDDALAGRALASVLRPLTEQDDAALRQVLTHPERDRAVLLTLSPAGGRSDPPTAPVWVQVSCATITLSGGEAPLRVLQLEDVTARKAAEDEARQLMLHDALTGLPNRRLFADRLEHALVTARRAGHHVAVLFVDLDRFKQVNDTYGHDAGDAVLRETARRLSGCLRSGDTVARMGGDEFAVVAPLQDGEDADGQVATILARTRSALAMPVDVHGTTLPTTASIGVAVAPPDEDTEVGAQVEELLRSSDLAMYSAKLAGRDLTFTFEPGMRERADRQQRVESMLREALRRQWLTVHYQPLRNRDGALVGLEALVRVEHPEHGLLLPATFLPVAESTGLIAPLGEWVLHRVMSDHEQVRSTMGEHVRMFYNLSSRQPGGAALVDLVRRTAAQTGFALCDLVIEITETAALEQGMDDALTELSHLGVSLALDDFGTGYSALAYLRRLPLSILKVDRSFVSGTSDGAPDRDIIAALVGLSRGLGLHVVSEGVETMDQLEQTMDLGSDMFQGFALCRPAPLEELVGAG